MPSTFTTEIYLEEPGLGDYVNSWENPVNSNFTVIDAAIGGSTTVAFTNTNVTLSVAQAAYFSIVCQGTLTANVALILPGTIGGRRTIFNQCSGAYTLTVMNGAGDTGGGVVVGQGFITPIVLTAGRAYYDAYGSTPPGTLLQTALNWTPPGFILCYGQTISRSTYSQLWSVAQQGSGWPWGNGDGSTTFNLPDFRGRLLAGADNMGGVAAGNLTGYTVGTTGGAQSIVLDTTQIPSHNHIDSGHVHTITDLGHNHTYNVGGVLGANFPVLSNGFGGKTSTDGSPTGISINSGTANIQNTGGGLSHSNVQPTAAVNVLIRY